MSCIFLGVLLLLLNIYETLRYKISPYPSNHYVQSEVIHYLKQHGEINKICDLGAGFGFFSAKLAKIFPNKEILAIEAALIPFFGLKLLKFYYQLNNLRIKRIDFFKINKLDSDCVFCFLYPDKKGKITAHLKNLLRKNVLVISSTFYLNLPLIKEKQMQDLYLTSVYYYHLD